MGKKMAGRGTEGPEIGIAVHYSREGHMPKSVVYISQVRTWVDAFVAKWGRPPKCYDGFIPGTLDLTWARLDWALPGENWNAVNLALYNGGRGLPGGSRGSCTTILAFAFRTSFVFARWTF
jgi:hypothetical protein